MDNSLFLMDTTLLNQAGRPAFYQGHFNIFNYFRVQSERYESLCWLLEELHIFHLAKSHEPTHHCTDTNFGFLMDYDTAAADGTDRTRLQSPRKQSRKDSSQIFSRCGTAFTMVENLNERNAYSLGTTVLGSFAMSKVNPSYT